jgi:Ca2+-binding RTX toxin-like protein
VSGNTFPDAVCTGIGVSNVGLTNTMTSGNGDGDSIFTIDGNGQLGFQVFYDPLGPTGSTSIPNISTTTYISTPSGSRTALRSSARPSITGNATESDSSFVDTTYNLNWDLCATVQKLFDGTGAQIGSYMTRTYTITNNTATTANFDIVNFNHMHMWQAFNPSAGNDAGGHIPNPGGTELMLETDRVGTPSTVAAFVAITGVHGTVPTTNRYELNVWPAMENRIQNGQVLQDLVNGDVDGDEFVDNPNHSVVAVRNVFSIGPGETQLYTAHTIFGNADPTTIGAPPVNVAPTANPDTGTSLGSFPVSIDVVSNDVDPDGALDYSTVTIASQPANGTAVSLGNGLVTYTPNLGFSGTDTFTYTIADNSGGVSAPTTVTITVIGADATADLIIGSDGSDTLVGAAGNDTINAGAGNDSADGGLGNDSITGGAGADTLFGNFGDDTLNGQGGSDVLDGGDANDTVQWDGASSGNDFLTDTTGDNTLVVNGSGVANTFTLGQSVDRLLTVSESGKSVTLGPTFILAVINGNNGNDTINVGDLSKVPPIVITVNGGAGNDLLNGTGSKIGRVRLQLDGGDGNDTVRGTLGDDTIFGGAGNDNLKGSDGNDTISAQDGDDFVDGEAGNDSVDGGNGTDSVRGGEGSDTLVGGNDFDTLDGGAGDDSLDGGDSVDSLLGGAGNDTLLGGLGTDTLNGGDGNDVLDGGHNNDSIIGGLGDDKIRGDHGNDTIDAGDGNDTVNGGDGNDVITGGVGNDAIDGGDGDDIVNGAAGNDTIVGGDGKDILKGGSGGDLILGEDGDDTIDGQGATDTVAGGQGIDVIVDPAAEINEAFVLPAALRTILDAL